MLTILKQRPLIYGLITACIWIHGSVVWGQAPSGRALTILADTQEANANTGVITATGNVSIQFPAEGVVAQSQKATYYTQEQRIVLEGGVVITQKQNQLQAEQVTYLVSEGKIEAMPGSGQQVESVYVFPDVVESPSP